MKTLVSIHDVMPDTMGEVAEQLQICRHLGVEKVTLLVVPGLSWSSSQIEQIRQWQEEGYELAAHGWHHKCETISTLKHQLHSVLLSRDVAEHLCLTSGEIAKLMIRSGNWFEDNGFNRPELYVPPAWALGEITEKALAETGFRMVETLRGVRFPQSGERVSLPLVGFEADTAVRALALTVFNGFSTRASNNRLLRVSLHPHDHKLRLQNNLRTILRNSDESFDYASLWVGCDLRKPYAATS
ncbi:polysaccharide deacetylase family protein [Cognatishimia activa]|uniref:DUF2334 domain-containing protein n=1 Tax=Cognatishimia activa TaxID=1715691 RepID=A0A0N7MBI1_9RHOB|nr:polysaccharide deacetylase family protein [Cognatishimia activa]CUJ21185.1 hypothetical protein TA5113_02661 [Cognatishimia activa]CUK25472.1 hypothetical protein TA5114_01271 [Cognatishimia activa]